VVRHSHHVSACTKLETRQWPPFTAGSLYNAGMNDSALILPFSLPPPELAKDLLRQMKAPALATLLGMARTTLIAADPYARVLPHQAWLLGRTGQPAHIADVAASSRAALGLPERGGAWFILHPAHFHIARDHLVLTDLRQLPLTEAESRALFDAAAPLFAETGMELEWGNARLWFLRAAELDALETSAPDMAVGHNIDIWMPRGAGEHIWRRAHNEVQMCWHAHAVNEARAMAGHKAVNALWCWNALGEPTRPQPADPAQATLALPAFLPAAEDAHFPTHAINGPLQVDDGFSAAALAGDWGRWLEAMHAAEQHRFAPALQALQSGRHSSLRLLLSDDRQLLQADCSRLALRKFWRRPSLSSLVTTREQAA
jgi:hypothetical protein